MTRINGRRVVAVLDRLGDLRGLPLSITVDHGPEFEGQVLDAWAYEHGVRLNFIRPGKPIEYGSFPFMCSRQAILRDSQPPRGFCST